MIPAAFDYLRVDSAEAALTALAEHAGDGKQPKPMAPMTLGPGPGGVM